MFKSEKNITMKQEAQTQRVNYKLVLQEIWKRRKQPQRKKKHKKSKEAR